MAKKTKVDYDRLCTAMRQDRLALRYYREERREAARQSAGSHWSEYGTSKKVPINLLSLYTSIVGRSLIAKNPRVMLSTFDRQQKPVVNAMESWANQEMEDMHLDNILRRLVLDGLYSVGIAKIALSSPADSALAAWELDSGKPFVARVDLDDFICDMHARDFAEVSYIGHRYRVPLDMIRDNPIYAKERKDLTASNDEFYNQEGDERINVIGRGMYSNKDEFEEMIDLWEIYIPRRKMVVTLEDNGLTGPESKPLREQDWVGPSSGPYRMLGFGLVPGNMMPKAPIMDLIDLHMLANQVYRKLMNQAERQKDIFLCTTTEDAEREQQTSDGEFMRVNNPDSVKPLSRGGPNQQNMGFFGNIWDLFNKLAGNLEMQGGLGPQSKTLGQDRMLKENASQTVNDMQQTTVDFTADIVESLCWFWHHDPFNTMKTVHPLPGLPGMSIDRKVTPQQRSQGKFEDMKVKVDPYSLQYSTPQSRIQAINQVVQTIILPMQQMLQQQGVMFDINAYLTKIGKYMDLPDLAEIVTMQEPPQQEPSQDQASGPSQTTRTYQRQDQGPPDGGMQDKMQEGAVGSHEQNGAMSNGAMR